LKENFLPPADKFALTDGEGGNKSKDLSASYMKFQLFTFICFPFFFCVYEYMRLIARDELPLYKREEEKKVKTQMRKSLLKI
jgi:hypothetical protein